MITNKTNYKIKLLMLFFTPSNLGCPLKIFPKVSQLNSPQEISHLSVFAKTFVLSAVILSGTIEGITKGMIDLLKAVEEIAQRKNIIKQTLSEIND